MGSEPTNSVADLMDKPQEFPGSAYAAAMKSSVKLNDTSTIVSGYDFNEGIDHEKILQSMLTTGFQASHLGRAIVLVNNMLDWRLSDEPIEEDCSEEERDPAFRQSVKCKIFMGFTSNLISSGLRDTIRFLAEHRMRNVYRLMCWSPRQEGLKKT